MTAAGEVPRRTEKPAAPLFTQATKCDRPEFGKILGRYIGSPKILAPIVVRI